MKSRPRFIEGSYRASSNSSLFMDITWLGQSCFKIKGRGASIVTDPYDEQIGFKLPRVEADIVTISHEHSDHNAVSKVGGDPFVVNGPGEYEIKGVNIVGISSFHDNEKGNRRGKNILFNLKVDNVNIAHMGDLGQDSLTSEQIEALAHVDILMVPCGGIYTIDAGVAAKIVSSVEPSIIIPMHYFDKEASVELEPVDKFLKEMGKEDVKAIAKLTITKERLPAEPQAILLEKA